jgi:hypothetical protein
MGLHVAVARAVLDVSIAFDLSGLGIVVGLKVEIWEEEAERLL